MNRTSKLSSGSFDVALGAAYAALHGIRKGQCRACSDVADYFCRYRAVIVWVLYEHLTHELPAMSIRISHDCILQTMVRGPNTSVQKLRVYVDRRDFKSLSVRFYQANGHRTDLWLRLKYNTSKGHHDVYITMCYRVIIVYCDFLISQQSRRSFSFAVLLVQ